MRWRPSLLGLFFYFGFYYLFRVLVMTLLTYYSRASEHPIHLHDLSNMTSYAEILLLGLSAFGFLAFGKSLQPILSELFAPALQAKACTIQFLKGYSRGGIVAICFVMTMTLSGQYEYLGFLGGSEDTTTIIVNGFLRAIGFSMMMYVESYLFQFHIKKILPAHLHPVLSAFAIACLYMVMKLIHFEANYSNIFTLFTIGMMLGAPTNQSFAWNAGWIGALLILFHCVCGLSVFGNDFPGLWVLRAKSSYTMVFGTAFNSILILYILISIVQNRKASWKIKASIPAS